MQAAAALAQLPVVKWLRQRQVLLSGLCLLFVLGWVTCFPVSTNITNLQLTTTVSKNPWEGEGGVPVNVADSLSSTMLTSGMEADALEAGQDSGPARRKMIVDALETQARLEATGIPQARDSLFNGLTSATGLGELFNRVDQTRYQGMWNISETNGIYPPGTTYIAPGVNKKPLAFPECMDSVGMSQYMEDKLIFNKYFKNPEPLRGGVFFEMGALDGWWLSNTYFFEQCLGWGGVLVEAHPDHFTKLRRHRTSPKTKRLWMGACDEDGGTISFASAASEISAALDQTTNLHKQQWSHAYGKGSIDVPCGPLGKYLEMLGVSRINFFSLDVEGAEIFVLQTIDWSKLSVHLLMVEASSNGPSPERDLLLGVGFELEPEGTVPNSALFVNRSFV